MIIVSFLRIDQHDLTSRSETMIRRSRRKAFLDDLMFYLIIGLVILICLLILGFVFQIIWQAIHIP